MKKDEVSSRDRLVAAALGTGFGVASAFAPTAAGLKISQDLGCICLAHAFFGSNNTTNLVAQSKGYPMISSNQQDEPKENKGFCVIL